MENKTMIELRKEKRENLLNAMLNNEYIFNNLNNYIKNSLKDEIREKTTIKEVAEQIGISYQKLTRVLSEKSNLPIEIIFKIGMYLDLDLTEFFNVIEDAFYRTLEDLAEQENRNINNSIKRVKAKEKKKIKNIEKFYKTFVKWKERNEENE